MVDMAGHPTWVDDRGAGDETSVLLHGGMSHSGLLLDALIVDFLASHEPPPTLLPVRCADRRR